MRLIVDENIPYGKEAFSTFGEVQLLNGREITKDICREADILIVRSITKVNRDLLEGTNIKFAGSATTGADHFDIGFLTENKIPFYIAAGCNAYSVVEYVFAAIAHLAHTKNFCFNGKKLGVIGAGKIGSKVAAIGKILGFEVIVNDPPLQRKTGSREYRPLEEALDCDIITFHVPLNKTGTDKTLHLINQKTLNIIKPGSMVINSSRGPVIDNHVLRERLINKNDIVAVLDVWENEPSIDNELLNLVDVGSAHIAGYSLEGKVNGTTMVYNELCRHLKKEPSWKPTLPEIPNRTITIDASQSTEKVLMNIFENIYDINKDNENLKASLESHRDERPRYFDMLRKNYSIRRELNNYAIKLSHKNDDLAQQLQALRLNVI